MYKVCRTILISSIRNTETITGAVFMESKGQVAILVVPEKCSECLRVALMFSYSLEIEKIKIETIERTCFSVGLESKFTLKLCLSCFYFFLFQLNMYCLLCIYLFCQMQS